MDVGPDDVHGPLEGSGGGRWFERAEFRELYMIASAEPGQMHARRDEETS